MSSQANRTSKQIKKELGFENTTVGSIIAAIGIISNHSYEESRKFFQSYKKSKPKCKTIMEFTNDIWDKWGDPLNKSYRANLILLTDSEGYRRPIVTLVDTEGNAMPLNPNGTAFGLLGIAREGRENVECEFLYDENGEEDVEDDNNVKLG